MLKKYLKQLMYNMPGSEQKKIKITRKLVREGLGLEEPKTKKKSADKKVA